MIEPSRRLVVFCLALAVVACGGGDGGTAVFEFEPAGLEFPITAMPPTPDPPTDPSEPEPQVTLSPVFIDAVEVKTEVGGVEVSMSGHLPTPCHSLRWEVGEPGSDRIIQIGVWSEADAAQICIQVTEPFSETVEIPNPGEGRYKFELAGNNLGELASAGNRS